MKLGELPALRFNYDAIGSTRYTETPAGYHRMEIREQLGSGEEVFRRAGDALMTWRMHRAAGLATRAEGRAEIGVNVLGRLGIGGIGMSVPCRVVWVVEDDEQIGFGYGTLPGHPASGEESFLVTLEADRSVHFTVRSYSRAATWYTRLPGPITRMAQKQVAHQYARTLRRLANR